MRKILPFYVSLLLWVAPAYAQDVGLFFAVDCSGEITAPVANRTLCMQSGGTAGLYLYTGTWTLIVASGGEAPSDADYFVGTAASGLSAERVGTDTATVDVDLGTAAQARFNVIANSIGPTQVDETASFTFTGTIVTSTTVASLGTATAGVFKVVTDGNTDCGTGGGSTVRLCVGNGSTWVTVGDGTGISTLDGAFDGGKTIDGANSAANAVQIGSATRWCIYHDATKGLRMLPCTASNTQTVVMTNFVWQLFDEEGDAAIATADPDAIGAGSGTLTMATSQQLVASNLGVEFTESDTNPACGAGNYNIYADLSETKLKKCQNGTATDLVPVTGAVLVHGDTGTNTTCSVAGDTLFLGLTGTGNSATEGLQQIAAPRAGTIKNLYARVPAAVPASGSVTFTLRKAGADTALACTIAAAGTACNDTSDSIAIAAADLITISSVCSGTDTDLSRVLISMSFE